MEKRDFVKEYIDAYKAMRDSAIEKIRNYNGILEVAELLRKQYRELSEDPDEEGEQDYINANIYWCFFEGKNGYIYSCKIVMVRWNKEREVVEVYLESNEGDVAEWFYHTYISGDMDMLWETIHEFIK